MNTDFDGLTHADTDVISQNTVVSQVMARMKKLIASGHYRPGDKLPTEQELAQSFGVGRSSIREAMKVFQHLGVLESKAAKGTFLRDRANISLEAITWALLLGDDDMKDVLELREAVESICFRKLAVSVSGDTAAGDETLQLLREQIEAMRTAARQGDAESLALADYRFHEIIIAAGGNRLFSAVYRTLQAFMRQEIAKSYESMASLEEAADDHADILRVLEEKPEQAAILRHSNHFQRTLRLLGIEEPPA
ncbi:MAG: FadR/GntR family transcriptional regulator [Spirochaetaceae bacterium]